LKVRGDAVPTLPPKPMRDSVGLERMEAFVIQKRLRVVARRWIPDAKETTQVILAQQAHAFRRET